MCAADNFFIGKVYQKKKKKLHFVVKKLHGEEITWEEQPKSENTEAVCSEFIYLCLISN